MSRKLFRLILLSLPAKIFISAIFAFTASNTVPESGMVDESHAITAEQLKPAACGDVPILEKIITTTDGIGTGTIGNDLVLGTAGNDALDGGGGDDCLVAGGGDEDVCTGGAGTDVFIGCETITDPD